MGSIWYLLAAALVAVEGARKRGPDYPIGTGNLPTIKSNRRVLGSQEFSIALPKGPADNQEIFVLFISADKIDQGKKKLKAEAKDDEGHVMAEIVYRITPDDFFHANVQKTKVPETEAKLNREEATLTFIDNAGENAQIAGFYWATVKEQEGDQIRWYKDVGTAVRTVEKCAMETKWADGVDIEDGYGWSLGSNGFEFNSKGFAPGTTFATCEFRAVPEVELTWSVETMGGGKNKIEAKVPATEVALPETITCSMPEDDIEYDEDHCNGPILHHKEVTSSPSRLEYAENVAPSSNEKVWTYMNATSTDQMYEFSCPLIDQAALVTVLGISQTGEKWVSHTINQVSNLLPEEHEDGFSCTETHCWKVHQNRYDLKINMTTFAVGLHEFACKYMTGDITQEGDLVGYSRPHILLKYTEDSSANSLVAEWGLGVDSKTFIKETDEHVNIANCLQTTSGKPAPMALKVSAGGSTSYFPRDFTEQHFISLNIPVPNTYDQANVACVYRNGEEEVESALQPALKVMFKPRNVEVVETRETIRCSAQVSSLDSVKATLSINDNFKKEMTDGVAIFNKTTDFTQAELEKSEKTGVSCTIESDTFGPTYSSNVGGQDPTEPPSMEIEVNLGVPMLLLIGGAVGVLAICFKMKPAEKKGEGGKYKLADTEESDVIDESDPLATAEKV